MPLMLCNLFVVAVIQNEIHDFFPESHWFFDPEHVRCVFENHTFLKSLWNQSYKLRIGKPGCCYALAT